MSCPIYVFPSNHVIYIYIITIVYLIETYIYIIKTSHVLLTYKSKCLTEVGKENHGCFWLRGKENPGDCVQKLAKILRTNVIITRSFFFWAITRNFFNFIYKKCGAPVYFLILIAPSNLTLYIEQAQLIRVFQESANGLGFLRKY